MALSLNAVVHYTDTLEKLKGILAEKFRIKYCLETVIGKGSAFPMVSFCDIPLAQVKDHLQSYGYYGIGLSKEWAKEKKLNPVLYINDNSYLDTLLRSQSDKINAIMQTGESFDMEWLEQYISLLSFVKSFRGQVTRNGVTSEIVFYNEREWRYVPARKELVANRLSPQIYGPTYEHNKDKMNSYLQDLRLTFEIQDIAYIIVNHIGEIHDMIAHLKKVFNNHAVDQIELLVTKIMTSRQIVEDF